MNQWLKDRRVLITGGTGSFGEAAVWRLLALGVGEVVIFSRDEYKQFKAKQLFAGKSNVRFLLGDVRDLKRLKEVTAGMDAVVHAAALKHIALCEENPSEALLTNTIGAQNVIEACVVNGVQCAVQLSADKAVMPTGMYGATKMLGERLFTHANISADKRIRFSTVRYSNVLGSRGSVVEVFKESILKDEPINVFDENMVRMIVTQDQVIDLVATACGTMLGGEIFVWDSPMVRIVDLAETVVDLMGRGRIVVHDKKGRTGEKYDAILISEEESQNALLREAGYFVILPQGQGFDRAAYTQRHTGISIERRNYGTATAKLLTKPEIKKLIQPLLQTAPSLEPALSVK